MNILELLKIVILGIVEGITEWLPISSTGHMLLFDEFLHLNMSESFKTMFFMLIQLGAIMAVVIIFWKKMFPFDIGNKDGCILKKDTISLWLKVIVACIPGAIAKCTIGDFVEENFTSPIIIAIALIFYGILFIIIESWNKKKKSQINRLADISYKIAFIIGLFQVLSLIPGTSRSGSTIIGALLIGVSRVSAAEFTFFLAVPAMIGASLLEIFKFGFNFTNSEFVGLTLGMLVSFLVSILSIKFLIKYIKTHDFKPFGWYRIVLGVIILIYLGM
ncbi:undecaprenyl-diphosphate phosphatase [Clostridium gasigenes]|uniref:undecaprenyl-diphosphate phosphatase n=1 Tax=Clostridium gasigenes TaxID=94869 RepID=UPI001C0C55C8|nr:undecaprenyl-diphosphate phosphatase [Clostridium gasigenes]MBU3102834.1 undecaprenyl-diphosphate phosphatase [Clostridium gasigenes]